MFDFQGTYTALVTPFRDDASQSIDWPAFDALLDNQLEAKIDGLVPCGTTGESPALTHEEHLQVIRLTVEKAKGRAKVLAGAGANATHEAIALCKAAEGAGADAVMVVVPYYNKPTQEGLFRHFVAVAREVRCPIVIYNIPGRTGIDLAATTLIRICEKAPNVIATKEATGNVLRAQELQSRLGERLTVLSGDDALTLPMIAVGARGVISVTSNVLPAYVARVAKLALEGDFASARRAHLDLLPVHDAMFVEANPGPVKAALALEGKMNDTLRGPLAPVTEANKKAIAAAIEAYKNRNVKP